MKALLVNPWIEDFAAYDLWARPLGLLHVGAMLEAAGAGVALIDVVARETAGGTARFRGTGKYRSEPIEKPACLAWVPRGFHRYGMSEGDFLERLDAVPEPDLVLVTCLMSYWYGGAFRAAALLRRRFPRARVLLGGVYAAVCQGHARKSGRFDAVLPEKDPAALARALSEWTGLEISPGFPPHPAYHLYGRPLRHAAMITGVGCPYRCTYCAAHVLYPSMLRKPVSVLISELENILRTTGSRDVAFYDDALLEDAGRHILPFFEEVARRGLPVRFHLPNAVHPRKLDTHLCGAMKRAGVTTLRLGFESLSAAFEARSSRKVDRASAERGVEKLFAAGFSSRDVGAYLLFGVPGLPAEGILDDIRSVNAMGLKVSLASYSPIPGTPDFEAAAAEWPELRDEPLLHNNTLTMARHAEAYREARRLADSLNGALQREK
ncbi:MAG: radical SAM protein [Acidobacteria bacterium]|nr:radical SAM protein [Acidobacteriota bacterium]